MEVLARATLLWSLEVVKSVFGKLGSDDILSCGNGGSVGCTGASENPDILSLEEEEEWSA